MVLRVKLRCSIFAIIYFVCCVFFTDGSTLQVNYILTCPKVYTPNVQYACSLNFLKNLNSAKSISLQIRSNKIINEKSIVSSVVSFDFSLPEKPYQDEEKLTFDYKIYDVNKNLLFQGNLTDVKIKMQGHMVMIQTDKGIYKPGQTVMIRAFTVSPTLAYYSSNITLSIYDASKNRVGMLENQKPSPFVNWNFSLSDYPILGDWEIKATLTESAYVSRTEIISIDKYVLPTFEVKLSLPSLVFIEQSSFVVSVEPKYTYGKPVSGKVTLVLSRPYYSAYMDKSSSSGSYKIEALIDAAKQTSVKFHVDLNQFYKSQGISDSVSLMQTIPVQLFAECEEIYTGKKQNTTASLILYKNKYKLEFMSITPEFFVNNMKFAATVRLANVDGSSLSTSSGIFTGSNKNEVVLTMNSDAGNKKMFTVNLDSSGIGYTEVQAPVTSYLNIEARITIDGQQYSATKFLRKFTSKAQISLQATLDYKDPDIGVFSVHTSSPVSYMQVYVIHLGKIAATFSVSPVSEMEYRVDISSVSQYSPKMRLVAVAVVGEELIATSLTSSVVKKEKQITLSLSKSAAELREQVQIGAKTWPGSTVAFLAVDQSVMLLKKGNTLLQSALLDRQMDFDGTKDFNWWESPMPMPMFRGGCILPWPTLNTNTGSIFASNGIIVATDGSYVQPPLYESPMQMGVMNMDKSFFKNENSEPVFKDVATVNKAPESAANIPTRSYFPESWIWTSQTADASGNSNINTQVPDTITSWVISALAVHTDHGVAAVEDFSKMRAFKNFFVRMNLPYQIVRGEELLLQVLVFNYLTIDVVARVTLDKSDSYKTGTIITDSNSTDLIYKDPVFDALTFEITVKANSPGLVVFKIVPVVLGSIDITCTAVSSVASDRVRNSLLVVPEGFTVYQSKAAIVNFTSSQPDVVLEPSFPSVDSKQESPAGIVVSLVPGSERTQLSLVGDIMGNTLQNIDKLLQMPSGCGEQNMLNFAPNIFVFNYLNNSGQLTEISRNKAIKFTGQGYQRELTYKRQDCSYSAFGSSDPAGSVWLTSFVLKSYAQALIFYPIDHNTIGECSLNYLLNAVDSDGSFSEKGGRVIHKDMQGGTTSRISMTAYIVVALAEIAEKAQSDPKLGKLVSMPNLSRVLKLSADFLVTSFRNNAALSSDAYTLSIMSYCMSVLEKLPDTLTNDQTSVGIQMWQTLKGLAKTEGVMVSWSVGTSSKPSQRLVKSASLSGSEIETAGYGLLTAVARAEIPYSLQILRFLSSQQNAYGGYHSTQDTVIGLQAMAAIAGLIRKSSGPTQGSIKISWASQTRDLSFSTSSQLTVQTLQLGTGTDARVGALTLKPTGSGVALATLSYSYNLKIGGDVLNLGGSSSVNGISIRFVGMDLSTTGELLTLKLCAQASADSSSGMFLMRIKLPTGYVPDDLDSLKDQRLPGHQMSEFKEETVILYLDQLTTASVCPSLKLRRAFSVLKQQPPAVQVQSYYEPEVQNVALLSTSAFASLSDCHTCTMCPGCSRSGYDNDNDIKESPAQRVNIFLTLLFACLAALLILV